MCSSEFGNSVTRRRWRDLLLIIAFRESCFPATYGYFGVDAFTSSNRLIHSCSRGNFLVLPGIRAPLLSADSNLDAKERSSVCLFSSNGVLSEIDAIKILRAHPRPAKKYVNNEGYGLNSNQPSSVAACKSASDVLRILQLTSSEHRENDQIEVIVAETKANVAAAALRRLLSPPFLPASFATTKKGIQYMNIKQSVYQDNISDFEKELYIQLTALLQKKLYNCVESQLETLSSLNIDTDSAPMLLHKNSTLTSPPVSTPKAQSYQLNWYALADMLFSSSVLSNLELYQAEKERTPTRNVYLQTVISSEVLLTEEASEQLDKLFAYLSFNNEITSSFLRSIGPRRVVRDVLVPIVVVQASRNRVTRIENDIDGLKGEDDDLDAWKTELEDEWCDPEDSSCNLFKTNINHIVQVVASYLSLPHSLEVLNCADLSTTLWCFAQIYSQSELDQVFYSDELQHRIKMDDSQAINLTRLFMKRLRKVAVHSMGSGRDITQAIWSVDRLIGLIEQQRLPESDQMWEVDGIVLPDDILFPGESTANNVHTSSHLAEPNKVVSVPREGKSSPVQLRKDASVMFYTLTKELLVQSSMSYSKLSSLTLEQLADVLQTAISLEIPRSDVALLITNTIGLLASEANPSRSAINQCNSCTQISRILWSLQRLRVGRGQFVDEKICVELLSRRFLALVRNQSNQQCTPKALVTSVRSAVLMFPGESESTDAILEAASYLILNDSGAELEYYHSPSFLMECNEYEVSNLLLAFALAKRYDEDVYLQLTAQMLEAEILESCSASSASRAMWSCAVLLEQMPSDSGDESYVYERQVDMYHQLSGVLLTSTLSPTDCASAMWAMAKANYALDKGCFDFLAQKLAGMLEETSTKLVAQAIWSCAKMARYESSSMSKPPYMESVERYLGHLIDNCDQMTPLQLSQTIYAMGSLRVSNPSIAKKLSAIVMKNAACYSCREIANIAWGLSKIDFNEDDIVLSLVQCVTASLQRECTSQEASNMLYALGKLRIKDTDTYDSLSSILMSQLQSASSQAIANALWAYDAVEMEAPIELMGCWAREKLGMDAFSDVLDVDD